MYLLHIQFHDDLIGIQNSEAIESVEIEDNVEEPIDESTEEQQSDTGGEQESLEHIAELIESLVEAIAELESRRSQSLSELQQVAVEIAVMVAGNVVRRSISASDYNVEDVVQEVISRLGAEKTVTVYLHPNDQQLFEAQWNGKESSREVTAKIQIRSDANLQPGDCYADAGDFGLLTTVEQQLADLRQMLLEGLEDAEVERRQAQSTREGIRRFPDRRETA